MNEQIIFLILLIITLAATLFLYLWKAKKQLKYKNAERWHVIQNKANKAANCLNGVLIVILAIGQTVPLFYDIQMTFTYNRLMTIGIIYIGIRNVIELFALLYLDSKR